jgi:NAD(P)-dependent dehydrogenase (short-subunit alcohol dehydrogenase family)
MELGLEDSVAVVTGASRGIGLAVVRALAFEGVRVIAGARRSSPALDELADGAVDVVLVPGRAVGADPPRAGHY